jgi:broad specificity phosphatase PhoE
MEQTLKRSDFEKYAVITFPMTVLFLVCLLMLLTGCSPTTLLVLRHAEKASTGMDPPLSPAGQMRAQELVEVAGEAGVSAIYATQFIRTQQTAQPLASHLGLGVNVFEVTSDAHQYAENLANHIQSEHSGEVVVIVSHSHTVPLIVEALGTAPISPIPGDMYDALFIVTVPRWHGDAKVVKAEYGD